MNTKCLKEQIHIGTNLTCLCCNYSPTISRGNPELWKFCPSCGVMWNGVFEIDAEKRNERQHNKNQGIKKTKWLVTYTEIGNTKKQTLQSFRGNSNEMMVALKSFKRQNPDLTLKAEIESKQTQKNTCLEQKLKSISNKSQVSMVNSINIKGFRGGPTIGFQKARKMIANSQPYQNEILITPNHNIYVDMDNSHDNNEY